MTQASKEPGDLGVLGLFRGTPIFMAPEILLIYLEKSTEWYNNKIDTWSIGCLLHMLLSDTMSPPFNRFSAIQKKDPPALPDRVDPELRTLVMKMLQKDPKMRPTPPVRDIITK